jgi:hypothetical protein
LSPIQRLSNLRDTRSTLLLAALAAVAATALSACGGGAAGQGTERAAARAVALRYMSAANADDGPELCAALSSAAQSEVEIGGTCAQALAGGLAGFDGPAEHFLMNTFKLTLAGSTGEVSVQFTDSRRRDLFRFPLIRQSGRWLVASALTWR